MSTWTVNCFIFTVLSTSGTVFAQQSLFQSGDGGTSLYTQRSAAALNFGDSKASVSYAKHDTGGLVLGYELFAKANSGVTNLFSSDKPKVPEGGGDVTVGSHFSYDKGKGHPAKPPIPVDQMVLGQHYEPPYIAPEKEAWWLFDVGYSRSSFYVANAPVAASAASRSFDRFRAIGVVDKSLYGKFIVGIAAGAERRNNLSDLKSVQFETVVATAPTGTTNSVVSTKTGYYGIYNEYIAAPIYADALWYVPDKAKVPGFGNRFAIDFLARADAAHANRQAKGGIGLFLFKKDDALTPLGGITVLFDGSKVQLGLTTGLVFGN